MNGYGVANKIMKGDFIEGPVLVHVDLGEWELWLDITDVKTTCKFEYGWVNGTVLEAMPTMKGIRAIRKKDSDSNSDIINRMSPESVACMSPEQAVSILKGESDETAQSPYLDAILQGLADGVASDEIDPRWVEEDLPALRDFMKRKAAGFEPDFGTKDTPTDGTMSAEEAARIIRANKKKEEDTTNG